MKWYGYQEWVLGICMGIGMGMRIGYWVLVCVLVQFNNICSFDQFQFQYNKNENYILIHSSYISNTNIITINGDICIQKSVD